MGVLAQNGDAALGSVLDLPGSVVDGRIAGLSIELCCGLAGGVAVESDRRKDDHAYCGNRNLDRDIDPPLALALCYLALLR